MKDWPRLWTVTLTCTCTFEIWRHEPYHGSPLQCGIPDHELGESGMSADWQPMTDVLIPEDAAADNAQAMHLLRQFAADTWQLDDAAQVSVIGPHWYAPDTLTGWWMRRPGHDVDATTERRFYRGQVKQAA